MRGSGRALILFAALGVVWGIPFLLIKIAVSEVDPAVVVLGRSLVGAAVLLPIAVVRRQLGAVLRRWRVLLAYTAAEIVVPWYFLGSAEQQIPSSTAGLLLAAVPLVGVLVAFLIGRPERMSAAGWIGLVIGAVGVAALVGLDIAGTDLLAAAQMALVAVGYAVGPVILMRSLSDLSRVGVVGASLAIAAIAYIPLIPLLGAWPSRFPSPQVVGSIAALGIVCSAAGFLLLFALVEAVGPVRATAVTYINPAVAIVAGALVLSEPVTVWTVVGFALVVVGSVLIGRTSSHQAHSADTTEPPSTSSQSRPSRPEASDDHQKTEKST